MEEQIQLVFILRNGTFVLLLGVSGALVPMGGMLVDCISPGEITEFWSIASLSHDLAVTSVLNWWKHHKTA